VNPIKNIINKIQHKRREAGGFRNLLLHTAFALTLTSGLSYFLGLVRDKTFAYTFGASAELDVYNAAFVIPDFFLALLVTGSLSAAFVPIFSNLDEHKKKQAIAYTNQIISYGLVILAIACAAFAVALPQLADFLVPGFDDAKTLEYIKVTRLMLISPFLFAVSNTFGNALISIKEFLWYGLAPVMYNIGIIIGVFFFAPTFGVMGLVMGTILGAFLHMLIRTPSMIKYGWRPRFTLKVSGEIKETIGLMIPKMLQIGMWQILLWWFIRLASQLEEGSVTIYAFARNFQSVPVSLIGIAIALAAFAELSHIAANKKYKAFKKIVRDKAITIVSYTSLAAITLAVLSYPIINILLGGGKFDEAAVTATASLLMVYCFAVPLESVMHLLARSHFALKNTLRPSLIHVFTISITMMTSAYLIESIQLFAIPAAFAIGLTLQVLLLTGSLLQIIHARKRETMMGKILN
jgi:putative peptidoglycan lipid II flippase